MIYKVFSMYDKKAQAYAQPFFFPHSGEAIRALEEIVNDPKSRLNRHPSDFSLYQVGVWDDISGKIEATKNPIFLEEAASLLKNQPVEV